MCRKQLCNSWRWFVSLWALFWQQFIECWFDPHDWGGLEKASPTRPTAYITELDDWAQCGNSDRMGCKPKACSWQTGTSNLMKNQGFNQNSWCWCLWLALPEYELRYLGGFGTNMKTERCVPTYCKSLYKQLSKSQRSAKITCRCVLKIMEKQDQQSWIDATTYQMWPDCWALKQKNRQLTSLTPFLSNPVLLHSTPCQRCGCILVWGKRSYSLGLVTKCRISLRVYSDANSFVGSFTHHTHNASSQRWVGAKRAASNANAWTLLHRCPVKSPVPAHRKSQNIIN